MRNNVCIDCAEQTAQRRKANSSIMLNPSARDTKIVSVDKISHFLEYCCSIRQIKPCTKVCCENCSVSYWWYNSRCFRIRHLFNFGGQHLIKVLEGILLNCELLNEWYLLKFINLLNVLSPSPLPKESYQVV